MNKNTIRIAAIAAVALGAEEIEFDLWSTKDGVIVSCHDSTLERVSTGVGNIWDYTYSKNIIHYVSATQM